ncbi:MAG: thiamine diphosphokinase [Clostridia bacterium]|nr:thiamine diphosphokinase [Clostridia bacterium]
MKKTETSPGGGNVWKKKTRQKSAVIVGASEFGAIPMMSDALLIAADGGLKRIESCGLSPDRVIGDFDSLGGIPQGENVLVYPPKKDDTDTMLASKLALSLGAKRVLICGALGGRDDHSFATLTTIAWISRHRARAAAVGDRYAVFALTNGSLVLPGVVGKVSVFAFGGTARGVKLEGLEYPFDGDLDPFFPIGVSNEARGEARISVEEGTLIIYANVAPERALDILEEYYDR